jgi:hypothetical protein
MAMVPGYKYSEISSISKVGPHKYLGGDDEGNGIIYTKRGGFIDLGHLRDIADWTAFLYLQVEKSKSEGLLLIDLGYEGGVKSLVINAKEDLNKNNMLLIAGKIAYDLSVWHEIATWYGASTVPMVPERYSSFSVEDAYSNLLGVQIAMEAIKSDLPYNDAITNILAGKLVLLGAVSTEMETKMALESVNNLWWTNAKRLPSRKVLIERELSVYHTLKPWLIPELVKNEEVEPYELTVPEFTTDGISLESYYQLGFKMNRHFRFKRIFPERKGRNITQKDFEVVLEDIGRDMNRKDAGLK